MTRRLAREEGLFAGTSSGANVVAALRVAERLGPEAQVVTLLCDWGLKYLNTDVYGSSSRTLAGSDEATRSSRLFALALGLFGGHEEGARNWLGSPVKALGDRTPLEVAGTEGGAKEVEALIRRLERGIPS
jgi:hypothetical protein